MTTLVQINTTHTVRAVFEDGFGGPGSITSPSTEVVSLDGATRTVINATVTLTENNTGEYSLSLSVSDTLFSINKDYFIVLSGIEAGQGSVNELISFQFRPVDVPITYSVDFS